MVTQIFSSQWRLAASRAPASRHGATPRTKNPPHARKLQRALSLPQSPLRFSVPHSWILLQIFPYLPRTAPSLALTAQRRRHEGDLRGCSAMADRGLPPCCSTLYLVLLSSAPTTGAPSLAAPHLLPFCINGCCVCCWAGAAADVEDS